jgi:hypothetical protein
VAFLEGDKISVSSSNLKFEYGAVFESSCTDCTDNKVATILWTLDSQGIAFGDRFTIPISCLLVYQNGPQQLSQMVHTVI